MEQNQIMLEAFIEFLESIYFVGFYQLAIKTNPSLIAYEYIKFVDSYSQAKQTQVWQDSRITHFA